MQLDQDALLRGALSRIDRNTARLANIQRAPYWAAAMVGLGFFAAFAVAFLMAALVGLLTTIGGWL